MNMPLVVVIAAMMAHAPFAVRLAWVDVREHRLPNRLVLGMSGATVAVAGVAALVISEAQEVFLAAVMYGLAAGFGAILLALVVPGSIGMGDAKVVLSTVFLALLAGSTALLGAILWICLWGAIIAGFTFLRTRNLSTRFAFGPVLLSAPYGGIALSLAGIF